MLSLEGSKPIPTVLTLLSFVLQSSAASTCYVAAYGLVGKQDGWQACPGTSTSSSGVETCCMPGSECGEDSLCHVLDSEDAGDNTWYQAGCTDPDYKDDVCRNDCVNYVQSYVQYDDATNLWMCCGNGGCNGTITDDTFEAVSPDDWKATSGGSAASSQAASSAAPSSTAPQSRVSSIGFKPTPTEQGTESSQSQSGGSSNSNNSDDGGLSTAAEAGIGVAIGLALLALIAALVAIFMMRRRNRQRKERSNEKVLPPAHSPPQYSPASELPTDRVVHEMTGEQGGYHWDKRH